MDFITGRWIAIRFLKSLKMVFLGVSVAVKNLFIYSHSFSNDRVWKNIFGVCVCHVILQTAATMPKLPQSTGPGGLLHTSFLLISLEHGT